MRPNIKKNISPFLSAIILSVAFIFSIGIMLCSQIIPIENFSYFIGGNHQKETTLLFVGDIMLDRGVEWKIKKVGNNDFKFPFLKVADELARADILFGNLESQISDKGYKAGSIYSFRADPKAIDGLVFSGFDVLSLANNHSFDYTRQALEDSMTRLKANKIDYIGTGFNKNEAYSPLIKEVNGLKIAYLAFTNLGAKSWEATENSSGIAFLNETNLKERISLAKTQADFVVVSLHFGDEYKTEPNDLQKYFSKLAIDEGANLIIGHHPHVVEPLEQYKNGWIAYSLGNFVFDQSFSEETMRGEILKVIIKNRKIAEVIPINIKINSSFQPGIEKK
jgi:poly-gamma-glutamate synthesis protein (capsule biosynthesis protein)